MKPQQLHPALYNRVAKLGYSLHRKPRYYASHWLHEVTFFGRRLFTVVCLPYTRHRRRRVSNGRYFFEIRIFDRSIHFLLPGKHRLCMAWAVEPSVTKRMTTDQLNVWLVERGV